jgi:adenosine deaminase
MHIEGSLEPEYMFELARRHDVKIPYASVEEVRTAYNFSNLQTFLDIYYAGASVLLKQEDFAELVTRYADRSAAEGVVHAEIFFDPQTHTDRGISFETVIHGLRDGIAAAQAKHKMTFRLIMSFLRHLSEADAFTTLEQARPFVSLIDGVGLDSSEVGHPPEKFERVFAACKSIGLRRVAHAGEEGPPEYIWNALKLLDVCRIDHGVATPKDPALLAHIIERQVPLTVCPCSNVCLKVFKQYEDMNVLEMLHKGVCVTINSDDPAYFGGYCGRNYEVLKACGLTAADAIQLAKNSFIASWLSEEEKLAWIKEIDALAAACQ